MPGIVSACPQVGNRVFQTILSEKHGRLRYTSRSSALGYRAAPSSTVIVPDDYLYPWIGEVEAYLGDREEDGHFEVYDDSEELRDEYLYFITGANEESLLAVASDVAALPGTPRGIFAVVTDDEAEEMGVGRRVPLR